MRAQTLARQTWAVVAGAAALAGCGVLAGVTERPLRPDDEDASATIPDATVADADDGLDAPIDAGFLDASLDGASDATGDASTDASADAAPGCDLDDPHHCGACGHDCSLGRCDAGVCVLLEPAVSTPTWRLVDLAVRGGELFVAQADLPAGLYRCPTSGCAAGRATVLDASYTPLAFTLTPTHVYFADEFDVYGASAIRRALLDGGVVESITGSLGMRLGAPGQVLAHANDVFWTASSMLSELGAPLLDGERFFSCPATGCTDAGPRALSSDGTTFRGLRVTASGAIVFASDASIRRCASADCPGGPATLATGAIRAFDVDATRLVFSVGGASTGIKSCPAAGCGGGPVDVIATATPVTGIALDGARLVWTEPGATLDGGTVSRCTLPACSDVRVLAQGQKNPIRPLIADGSVYWITVGGTSTSASAQGTVAKAPLGP